MKLASHPYAFRLILLLVVALTPTTTGAFSVVTGRGDLDNDGRVTSADVALIRSCSSSAACPPSKADMNGDGLVNTADADVLDLMLHAKARYRGELAVDSATTYNYSSSSDFQCRTLATRAYQSLRLPRRQGIAKGDILFCSRYFLVWIDNTGFSGELNGLFLLNGATSGDLDFLPGDDGLPRNIVVVSENHDGKFHPGYLGGTHIEVYHETASEGYATQEAAKYRNPAIPWWRACNRGKPRFSDEFPPYSIVTFDDALLVLHEARLTKEADMSPGYPCENAHGDYLFPDGIRRPLYLRTGWLLQANLPELLRTVQARNPAGNPAVGNQNGSPYIVYSFVLSSITKGPTDKQFRNYIVPGGADITNTSECGPAVYRSDLWNYNGGPYLCSYDNVINYTQSPDPLGPATYLSSVVPRNERGKTILSFSDPNFTHGLGVCDCITHGAYEVVSGTMPDLKGLPGGSMTNLYYLGLYFPGY